MDNKQEGKDVFWVVRKLQIEFCIFREFLLNSDAMEGDYEESRNIWDQFI